MDFLPKMPSVLSTGKGNSHSSLEGNKGAEVMSMESDELKQMWNYSTSALIPEPGLQ